ncbi:MAG: GNAT family N-acetyltransferase [Ruminococcaceae bacterium]|nr:GNAT family N-acetyltransferase [Oscillospiraceae bacterium]
MLKISWARIKTVDISGYNTGGTMKYTTPMLATERLILKRGTFEDFQKVYEYDFRKLRDICGECEYEKLDPKLIEGFELYADDEDVLNWILFLKDTNEPIGDLVADRIDHEQNSIEIAYNLHPDYWGHGYMPEAVKEAMKYLFDLGFDSIVCAYDEGNVKSKRVIEKLGFNHYKTVLNSWVKNGIPITSYNYIISKADFENKAQNEQ